MGTLQTDLRGTGALVVMISPGRVDTRLMRDSGWTGPSIPAAESARSVIERIALLDETPAGQLVIYDGEVVPR
jgi:NAD(P)-dependent dehydrogenase (short-subunit alcohol dehydrogenase family)